MRLIPATVANWDGVQMRVHIPTITDGAEMGMQAEVCYPFSDRPDYTGFKILPGDPIWVMFNNDDPNQPIVMGFRNVNTGAFKDSRRFRHQNIELNSESHQLQTSQHHDIQTQTFTLNGNTLTFNGELTINGNVKVNGKIGASGDVKGGAISLQNHTHIEQGDGKKTTIAQ